MWRPVSEAPAPLLAPLTDLPRAGAAQMVVEGTEAVRWFLGSRHPVAAVVGKATCLATLADELAAAQLPTFVAERSALSRLLGFDFQRGVVAWGPRPRPVSVSTVLDRSDCRRLVVLDAVHDPNNLGALARSARCLGYDAVLLTEGSADPWYRRSLRASVGHLLRLPVVGPVPVADCIAACRQRGIPLIAAHRGPDSRPVHRCRPPAGRWGLVLGNEDRGIRPELLAAAACRYHIPLIAGVDSLNVAVAGGIFMYRLRDLAEGHGHG